MVHNYPYTDFHELNLDYLMELARRSLGIHLETEGNFLKLVNQNNEVISKLEVTYAQTALKDTEGNNITAYILNAGVNGRSLVLTKGNGVDTYITIPYAEMAEKDINNRDITSYVRSVGVSGNKILVTFGNDTTYSFTVPYATKASEDPNGKLITSYIANLSTGNDKLIVKDGENNILAELTIPYATKALQDIDGDNIKDVYGTELTIGTTTVELRNKIGVVISTITVPYATKALSDNQGNDFISDYGYHLAVNGNKIGIESHNGTTLNEITVPFATLSTDAVNAIESVTVSGDNLVFTTYDGTSYTITVPYAVKALKDDLNNTLSHTYIANAVNDPVTGKITFYAQDGSIIAEMVPQIDRAIHDSYNNLIADYVKTIVSDPNSNYITITHGTGTVDSLTVHYSTTAWKDTYNNVIGNTYIRRLACEVDPDTNHYMLVAYNGELSELFRIELIAYKAECDINGRDITSYIGAVEVNGADDRIIDIVNGNDVIVNAIKGEVTTTPAGTISASLPSATYDANTYTLAFDPGTLPTFTGTASTNDINFSEV